MRIGPVLLVGLLLLTFAAPASAAGPELYLLSGVAMSNLGGDAEEFGDLLAVGLETEFPGSSWTSTKKSRTGYDLGVGARYGTSDLLRGVFEVRYATRGAKYDLREISGADVSATMTLKLAYLEMPLLLEVTPAVSGSVRPVFVVGPVLAFKATSEATIEAEGGGASVSVTQDLDGMKSAAFGGIVGAGISVKTGSNSNFLLQGRFHAGFNNLVDDPDFSIKPQDFSILAGWSMTR